MVGLVCLANWRCSAIAGPLVLVYFGFCSTSASAGTRRDDIADSAYTDLAAQPDFQSVGKLTSTGLGLGSGTLIDSRWVLTAGHMLSFPNPSGVTFNINGVDYTAAEWIPHPLWNSDVGVNGFDIGLIRLNASVPGVTPASRYMGSAELGASATIVGYGSAGTGLTGWQSNTYGTKRAGNNVIDVSGVSVLAHENYLVADFDRPNVPSESSFGSSTPLGLEYSSAPGDSGGGVFINDGGVQRLAGVVSFGQHGPTNSPDGNANADYGDLLGFTRVSAFNSWIDDQISARYWNNATGGSFDANANWDDNSIPASGHVAVFNTPGTYTVNLTKDTNNKRIRVRKGDVTLNLAGHSHTLANTAIDQSIVVGQRAGDDAKMTIRGGGTVNAVDVLIGELLDARGRLTLSGAGTLLNASGSVAIGGSPAGSAGFGTLTVESGASVQIAGTLHARGFLILNGGIVTSQNVDLATGRITGLSGGSLLTYGTNSTWDSASLSGGAVVTIAPDALLSLKGSGNKQISGGVLNIAGTADWTGSGDVLSAGSLSSTINILPGGVFDIRNNEPITGSGNAVLALNNAGIFRKNGGNGSTVVGWVLNNTGSVEIRSGTLQINWPVSQLLNSTLTGGTWHVLNSSTLWMLGGSDITTLEQSAVVRLSGSAATFAKINALTTNNGTFQIDAGKNFTVASAFTNNGTLIIGDGSTFTANDVTHSLGAGTISINEGGNLLANHLRANASTIDGIVTVRANEGTAGASKVESLSIGLGGKLNLRNNDLVIGTGDLLGIRNLIKAGISNVTNTAASSGITSDMMTKNVHGFGYATGNDSHISSLLSDTHTLSGQSYDADSVLVKFTYRGDADLDGDSDLGDLGFWADSFTGDLGGPVSPVTLWTQGDWDYDGDTDLDDLGFWSGTFTGDLGGGGLSVYAPNAPAGAVAALSQMGITTVPEAGTASLLGIGMLALAMRRRRLVAR
jgi:T5SS/PEP-CTERM-associated repeat protein